MPAAPASGDAAQPDEPVALEAYLQGVLADNTAAEEGSDAGSDAGDADASLEAEFAALLRGESGSSGSLQSVDDEDVVPA